MINQIVKMINDVDVCEELGKNAELDKFFSGVELQFISVEGREEQNMDICAFHRQQLSYRAIKRRF